MRDQNKDYNNKVITLRVKDAFKEDSGKGRIRIDPEVVKKRKIKTGDAIEIFHPISKSKTAALLFPGKPEDSGSGTIRLDPFLRRNINVTIDDYVEVRKIKAALAEKVVFANLSESVVIGPRQLNILLENRIVTKNDILSFYALRKKYEMIVVDFEPRTDAVRIHLGTDIKLSDKTHKELLEREKSEVPYEDIGGLADEIQRIRQMIELPIKHPELFQSIGIDPPKGVLLHGPSGTGKTLLAKAVAFETDTHFITISGPEIMSKFYGQSEQNLRNFFEVAKKNAPSIIFIDELDSIAPKRGEVTGEVERRVVAQLLSLLDGLEGRGEVIVIGATNKLEFLEPALLSPGRFDRIIEIKLPEEKSREEIFGIHTRNMPLEKSVSIQALAKNTQNFSGADISGVCKEAAMFALNRFLPEIDLESKVIDSKSLEQIKINANDFDQGIRIISRNVKIREILMENNKTKDNNN